MSATCKQNLVIAIERYLVKTDVRWDLSDSDLLDMTPIKARDLIVECFYQAQKETISDAGRRIGQAQNQAELRNTVSGAVRLALERRPRISIVRPSIA